jgi:hypothetical protein
LHLPSSTVAHIRTPAPLPSSTAFVYAPTFPFLFHDCSPCTPTCHCCTHLVPAHRPAPPTLLPSLFTVPCIAPWLPSPLVGCSAPAADAHSLFPPPSCALPHLPLYLMTTYTSTAIRPLIRPLPTSVNLSRAHHPRTPSSTIATAAVPGECGERGGESGSLGCCCYC